MSFVTDAMPVSLNPMLRRCADLTLKEDADQRHLGVRKGVDIAALRIR
jgi:hypothetical protein